MVADSEVESEKVSSVRYIGKLDLPLPRRCGAAAIWARAASAANVERRPAGPASLPVLTSGGKNLLCEDGNGWLAAWNQHRPADGVVHLVLPLGDAADVAAIDGRCRRWPAIPPSFRRWPTRYGGGRGRGRRCHGRPGRRLAIAVKRYSPAGAAGGFEDKFAGDARCRLCRGHRPRWRPRSQQDWIAQNQVTSQRRAAPDRGGARSARWSSGAR